MPLLSSTAFQIVLMQPLDIVVIIIDDDTCLDFLLSLSVCVSIEYLFLGIIGWITSTDGL